ncbi:aspartyl protease APCB1 [Henckelia pumila]|uniref:aspartyl protease APCB1 n=1 Tax=Henckelia pumila TaxID=405737 RepID=UPI003C6DC3A3
MEVNPDSSPQLTGVVIITLPPPDNPSLGKTITAYTLSNDDQTPIPHVSSPPLASQNRTFSVHNFLYKSSKTVLPILGISLVALYLWVSLSGETLFELRYENGDDDRRENNGSKSSVLFPLYRKPYGGRGEGNLLGEVELKLGRFVGSESRPVLKVFEDGKSVSVASKIDASSVVPVKGNIHPDGLYYTYLLIGNPPRPYFLDLDTGSDLTWIQCDAPCTSCAKGAHPFYKPAKANIIPHRDSYCVEVQGNQRTKHCDTCHQCDYEIEYADHSSSLGVLARDELNLNMANGSLASSKVVFGCAYDQQGLLLNTLGKTDGILGLSKAKISLPSQLARQGIIKNVIGHCLATSDSGGGYLFFGDDFVPHQQISWVPMLHSNSLNAYQTEIVKISYGRRQIEFGNVGNEQGSLVFDTGSTYTYFTEEAYNDLVSILDDISSESLVRNMSDSFLPVCWQANAPLRSVEDIAQFFKPLNLQFRSNWWAVTKKLQIPPEGYLVKHSNGNVCLGILNGRKLHDGSTFILGDISMRGRLFVYDNVNEKIGWVLSHCALPQGSETHSL